ncbi:MAG TPA: NAD(P)-dependent oxidoreductase [Roseiflexaceae bacterium]|nr:NAD(P)-dependent oxidoreductase [Roseiflexaceae bacterium]
MSANTPQLSVLVTGAAGYIAGQLLPALEERYQLRATDIRATRRDGSRAAGIVELDLLAADDATVRPLFEGVDVVVHLGYIRPAGTSVAEQYAAERRNVDLMQRVYQMALECGVRRVVAASTNQAARWYEQPYFKGLRDRVSPDDYPRPDNLYGWAKAAYETLGFVYACGSLGRQLEVVHVRIVVPREIDPSGFEQQPRYRYIRELAGYISERDLRQLFIRSIEAPNIDDEHGVPFQIFYGVSNNARTFWSIANARRVIGYAPEDDSEQRFGADIRRLLYGE